MYVCMYVCMYVRMFVRIYVCIDVCAYVCTYVCFYVCMCVCVSIYVCTYLCMYACIYEQFKTSNCCERYTVDADFKYNLILGNQIYFLLHYNYAKVHYFYDQASFLLLLTSISSVKRL